jgi:DNA-binding transcriptional ArsR family regulator
LFDNPELANTDIVADVRALPHPAPADLRLELVLHALGDQVRLEAVRRMAVAGETTCGLADLGVPKSTLSNHWRILREAGLTRTRTDGRTHWMTLRREDLDTRFPGLLDAVVAAAAAADEANAIAR